MPREAGPGTRAGTRAEAGRDGEERGAKHLLSLGYRILARNWRGRRGELDLVAEDGEVLCFVEVRQRGAGARVGALESIDRRKQERVINTAQEFLLAHKLTGRPARFDVIAIDVSGELTHLRHAFTLDR